MIDRIRNWLSTNYSDEILRMLDNEATRESIKDLIRLFLSENNRNLYKSGFEDVVNKVFDELVGFAFLENYIYDENIEEINGLSWKDIEIVKNDGWKKVEDKFTSSHHARNIIKKMMRLGGVILDEKQPIGDSYISSGTRISAMIPPIVDEEVGVVFSIRKQKAKVFSKKELVELGTCLEEEFLLLSTCLKHRVSVGIAGSTSSGKTSDIISLIASFSQDKRIFVIEDTRETFLDEKENRVIYTKTRDSDEAERNISSSKLLKTALRFHPDLIVPAEIRDQAALIAVEAGRTGHAILTGLHANSAIEAYDRILSMCMMKDAQISEALLMKFIISAFPIMVYKAQLPDYSRKYMEIFEVEDYDQEKRKVIGRTLYKYKVDDTLFDENGKVIGIKGEHLKINSISNQLARTLLKNGCSKKMISKFADKSWDEENDF